MLRSTTTDNTEEGPTNANLSGDPELEAPQGLTDKLPPELIELIFFSSLTLGDLGRAAAVHSSWAKFILPMSSPVDSVGDQNKLWWHAYNHTWGPFPSWLFTQRNWLKDAKTRSELHKRGN